MSADDLLFCPMCGSNVNGIHGARERARIEKWRQDEDREAAAAKAAAVKTLSPADYKLQRTMEILALLTVELGRKDRTGQAEGLERAIDVITDFDWPTGHPHDATTIRHETRLATFNEVVALLVRCEAPAAALAVQLLKIKVTLDPALPVDLTGVPEFQPLMNPK